jgi:hypothetical protein
MGGDYDGDGPTVRSEVNPIARKPYSCSECRRAIEPGERYRRIFMVYDGDPLTHFTCRHCTVATEWLVLNCGGWVFDHVLEDIEEHIKEFPGAAESLWPLSHGMRRQWKADDGRVELALPALPPRIEAADLEAVA